MYKINLFIPRFILLDKLCYLDGIIYLSPKTVSKETFHIIINTQNRKLDKTFNRKYNNIMYQINIKKILGKGIIFKTLDIIM